TRHRRNRQLRHKLGFVPRRQSRIEPQLGETVVCVRNDYSVDAPVFNGSRWQIERKKHVGTDAFPILQLDLSNDDDETTVEVPLECFVEHRFSFHHDLQMFDFGYVLTVHKGQGSEWHGVMLVDESACFDDPRRWLYTGITRARRRL